MNPSLPFIAFRIREHNIHARVWRNVVIAYSRSTGLAIVSDWNDCRRLLGYA